jgi:hypothetical protein
MHINLKKKAINWLNFMSNLIICIYSGGGGREIYKAFKGNKSYKSLGTSGIVPYYRLDDQGSIPEEANDFSSSLCVQTSSEAHPNSYPLGTGGSFPGVKRGRGVTLTTHSHQVPRSRECSSYTVSLLCRLHGEYRDSFYRL